MSLANIPLQHKDKRPARNKTKQKLSNSRSACACAQPGQPPAQLRRFPRWSQPDFGVSVSLRFQGIGSVLRGGQAVQAVGSVPARAAASPRQVCSKTPGTARYSKKQNPTRACLSSSTIRRSSQPGARTFKTNTQHEIHEAHLGAKWP